MRKFTMLMAAVLAVGLIGAGCGGDDDDNSTSDTTEPTTSGSVDSGGITKDEFLAQGNAICKESNADITQAFDELSGQTDPAQQETVVAEAVVPAVQSQIDGIRDLGAPAGEEDQVNAILDAAQEGNDKLADDPSIILSQGPDSDPFAEANQLAAAYGLTECAS